MSADKNVTKQYPAELTLTAYCTYFLPYICFSFFLFGSNLLLRSFILSKYLYLFTQVTILHTWCIDMVWFLKNKRPTWCHLLFYFTSYVLNMFRTLIYPSSGAILLNYHIGRVVIGSMCVGDSVWLGRSGIRVAGWSFSNTHRTKNNTTNVVIQQNSSWWWIY